MKPGGTLAPHLMISNPGLTDTELPLSSSYRASPSWTGPRSSRSTNCCWIWLAIFVCQRGTGRTISRTAGELIQLLAMIFLSSRYRVLVIWSLSTAPHRAPVPFVRARGARESVATEQRYPLDAWRFGRCERERLISTLFSAMQRSDAPRLPQH